MQGQPLVWGARGEWLPSGVAKAGPGEKTLKKLQKPGKDPAKSKGRTRAAAGGLGQLPGTQLLPLQGKFAVFAGGS